ncbi:hypothetical protein EMIT040CA3_120002 [Bacillus pseudomycoides]
MYVEVTCLFSYLAGGGYSTSIDKGDKLLKVFCKELLCLKNQ